ncbi:MAG: family F420-dependent class oxidoreductase [Deltaproteobacteria bacterium]|nr:family F420-dependent class oxidoreductase [Deltaproteobacteria bacterium]
MDVFATMDQRMPLAGISAHAQRAERLGYTGLHVPEAVHDGLLMSLRALEHTTTLRVATSVLLAFPRSPMTTAYAAWDLAALSGGRFELGLGSQVRGNVEGRFGVAWSAPVPRMREYVRALRAIWACWQDGTPLDFASEQYRFARMQPFFDPGPIEHPAIRIAIGAVGPAMTRLAGEVADALVTHPTQASPRVLRERAQPQLAEGLQRAGRATGACAIVAGGFVATGRDAAAVAAERERIREYLGFLYSTPQYGPALEVHGFGEVGRHLHQLAREGHWGEMCAAIPDALLDALVAAAPFAEIADVLRAWFGDLCTGITFPVPTDPADDALAAAAIAQLRG